MDSYKVYRWMLAGGLGLKGLSQSLFALVFSYSRCETHMFARVSEALGKRLLTFEQGASTTGIRKD